MNHRHTSPMVLFAAILIAAGGLIVAQEKPVETNAERQGRTHLAMRFKNTKQLLADTRKNDSALYQQLVAYGNRFAAADEATALKLARTHHPELADLLMQLKDRNRTAYDRAVIDLLADATKLQHIKAQRPETYATAVEVWKLDSQVRLLVAQNARQPNTERQAELERLALAAEVARKKDQQAQANRSRKQLEKLEARAAGDPAEAAKARLASLNRKLGSKRKTKNKAKKP